MDYCCRSFEPTVNVVRMATIVEEYLRRDPTCLKDARWLQERAEALGLSRAECAALAALQPHLADRGSRLLARLSDASW